jgi:hypothetical protein
MTKKLTVARLRKMSRSSPTDLDGCPVVAEAEAEGEDIEESLR